jgi:hypothetical protein
MTGGRANARLSYTWLQETYENAGLLHDRLQAKNVLAFVEEVLQPYARQHTSAIKSRTMHARCTPYPRAQFRLKLLRFQAVAFSALQICRSTQHLQEFWAVVVIV